MSYKTYSMELAGRTLSIDIGRVAKQANGAALMHYGDTTVLCTATASDKPREGIDFFPLSVEFEEKMYSVGKIPGGFNKREGKASENAVLTARVIDRPMRPLFPKDYRNDCSLNNLVLSVVLQWQQVFLIFLLQVLVLQHRWDLWMVSLSSIQIRSSGITEICV